MIETMVTNVETLEDVVVVGSERNVGSMSSNHKLLCNSSVTVSMPL